jgi:hypothetical protein
MAQAAVCSEINTKHINPAQAEHTIVKIFNLLVHPLTSRLFFLLIYFQHAPLHLAILHA